MFDYLYHLSALVHCCRRIWCYIKCSIIIIIIITIIIIIIIIIVIIIIIIVPMKTSYVPRVQRVTLLSNLYN